MTRSVLSNCYVPVKVAPQGTVEERQSKLVKNRSNGDGEPRTKDTLRRLYLESSILSTHAGSSLVELGHTKIIFLVPFTLHQKQQNYKLCSNEGRHVNFSVSRRGFYFIVHHCYSSLFLKIVLCTNRTAAIFRGRGRV
jgi:hypothetical protein